MATTFNWIHLGSSRTQLDPTEGNGTAENAGAFVGSSYGTAGNPLFSHVTPATMIDKGGLAGTLDQNNSVSNDQFTTNIGAGPATLTFDASVVYDATVTYADGTTATITAVVVQDTTGQLFLAPEKVFNADTSVLEAKPIMSLTLNGVNGSNFSGMATDRQVTGFDDGYIDGSAGNDLIDGSYVEAPAAGSDKVDNGDAGLAGAQANDDHIRAGAGDDTVFGGAGNDRIDGGAGQDKLAGGAGRDTLTGGAGNDRFVFNNAGGGDTITDFDLGDGDANGTTNDQLDVSDLRTATGEPVKIFDVVVGVDAQGNAVLTFPGGETVVLQGISPAMVNQPGMLHAMGIPCFAAGTMIRTPQGERAVEAIRAGDLVVTPQGEVPVLWQGARRLGPADLAARPYLRPVRLAPGAVGNRCGLRLSPQHAVLVPGQGGGRLIRALHLAEATGGCGPAQVAHGVRQVSYHHLLLPAHGLVWANGALAESFYPGKMAVAALTQAARLQLCAAIIAGFPSRACGALAACTLEARYGPRCLPLLPRRAALVWLAQNGWGAAGRNQRQTVLPDVAAIAGAAAPFKGKSPAEWRVV